MDQNSPPRGKSYSEVMNEWAAQQAFVKSSRSRLLHPPYDAHPAAKIVGYLVRLIIVLVIPSGIYIALVLKWAGSDDFNSMLTKGLAPTLNAGTVKTTGASWQISGQLAMPSLEATGAPEAFYEKLHAETVTTRVPVPMFIRRDWLLPRVSIASLSLSLRSGGAGTVPIYELKDEDLNMEPFLQNQPSTAPANPKARKTGALTPPSAAGFPRPLMAGYGIAPDFSALTFNALLISRLNLTWGETPAAAGSLTEAQSECNRTAHGWKVSVTGGDFAQGWLNSWKIVSSAIDITRSKATIGKTEIKHPGGGTGNFEGGIILGDVPEVSGHLQLENVPLQDLVSPVFASCWNAEVNGDLTLSGSTNRAEGIRTEGTFQITSGRFSPLHLLNALQRFTGETQFASLPMKGGRFTLKTGGAEGKSGIVVEIPSFEISSNTAKITGHLRYERARPLGTQLNTAATAEKEIVTGVIKIGLPRDLAEKFPPAVAKKFLVPGDEGWSWIELPLNGPPSSDPTAVLASEMVLMAGGEGQ